MNHIGYSGFSDTMWPFQKHVMGTTEDNNLYAYLNLLEHPQNRWLYGWYPYHYLKFNWTRVLFSHGTEIHRKIIFGRY